jgi:hypothetical protein
VSPAALKVPGEHVDTRGVGSHDDGAMGAGSMVTMIDLERELADAYGYRARFV